MDVLIDQKKINMFSATRPAPAFSIFMLYCRAPGACYWHTKTKSKLPTSTMHIAHRLHNDAARYFLFLLCMLLTACGPTAVVEESLGRIGGGSTPYDVVSTFLDEFGQALKDPQIQNDAVRERRANILADFFTPGEREDQRVAFSAMLDNYAGELKTAVAPNETFVLELVWDDIQAPADPPQRALVKVVNGRVAWQVLRDGYIIDEQQTLLSDMIGRADSSLPVVKVGTIWFLTENYE